MNIIAIILLVFKINIIVAGTVQQKTIISGYIPEAKGQLISIDLHIIIPENIEQPSIHSSTTSTDGYFKFNCNIDKPRQVTIEINGQRIVAPYNNTLFVEPGDSLSFEILNLSKLGLNNISCSGIGCGKINFLREKLIATKTITDHFYDDFKIDSIPWLINYYKKISAYQSKILKSYSNQINEPMMAILRSEVVVSNFAVLFEKIVKNWNRKNSEIIANRLNVDSLLLPLNDTAVIYGRGEGNFVRTVIMGALLKNLYSTMDILNEDIFYNRNIDQYYDMIESSIGETAYRDFVLAKFIDQKVKVIGLNQEVQYCVDKFLNKNPKSNLYKSTIYALVENINTNLQIGKIIPEFILEDTQGNHISLHKYWGKVVVLDFWFTGCIPCKKLVPYLTKIENNFEDNPNIVFLSISIDRNKETWLNNIGIYSSNQSEAFYTSGLGMHHPLIRFLNFDSFPTIIVIGKSGELITTKTTNPDIKDEESLMEFLKILNNSI